MEMVAYSDCRLLVFCNKLLYGRGSNIRLPSCKSFDTYWVCSYCALVRASSFLFPRGSIAICERAAYYRFLYCNDLFASPCADSGSYLYLSALYFSGLLLYSPFCRMLVTEPSFFFFSSNYLFSCLLLSICSFGILY